MKPALLVCGIVIALAIVFYLARKPSSPRNFKNTQEFIDFLSGEAVKDAETQSHVHLDYSTDSIRQVESILGTLHDQYTKNASSIAVKGLASAYGAYVGEVIRRSEPNVRWETSDAAGGEKSYPLIWAAGHSYPMAWCYRRIVDGDGDNVWVKYRVLKERGAQRSQATGDSLPSKRP